MQLNDPHYCGGYTGSSVSRLYSLSDRGHFVGVGSQNGKTRGFVFVRRTNGN
jgi:hypothetical protein